MLPHSLLLLKGPIPLERPGLILKAVPGDSSSDLHPSKVVERPKVAFNPRTRKFVMWMHIDSADYQTARAGVAIADSPTGRFQYLAVLNLRVAIVAIKRCLWTTMRKPTESIPRSGTRRPTSPALRDWLRHSGRYVRVFPGKAWRHLPSLNARENTISCLRAALAGPNPTHAAVATPFGSWHELAIPALARTPTSRSDHKAPMSFRWSASRMPTFYGG